MTGRCCCSVVSAFVSPSSTASGSAPFTRRPGASRQEEVGLFLNALANAGSGPPPGARILFLDIDEDPGDFLRWLRVGARRPSHPDFVRQLLVVDLAEKLLPEHFYALDDHLRPAGHAAIAEALLALIPPAQP